MTVQDSTLGGKTRHGLFGGFQVDVGLEPRVNYVASQTNGEATSGGFDLAELARQVTGGVRDSGNAKCSAVPNDRVVEFSDGDVKAVAQLVFEGAYDLATVLEGLCMLDGELEGECGERHGSKVTEV
jgi:hypothetical protein